LKLTKGLEKQVSVRSMHRTGERPAGRVRDRRLILAVALSAASVGLGIGIAAVAGLGS